MSSLQQLIDSRRAAQAASSAQSCHTKESQPACLMVTTAGGEKWVFPWAHFAFAHYVPTDRRESLTLGFTSHEVRLIGVGLKSLRDLVASFQLARVQPAPNKFQKTDAEPFCESVEVVPLPRATERKASSGQSMNTADAGFLSAKSSA